MVTPNPQSMAVDWGFLVLANVAYFSLRLRNQYAKYATMHPLTTVVMMLTNTSDI